MRRGSIMVLSVLGVLTWSVGVRADVFHMGGTRNPNGTWTGLASLDTVSIGNAGNTGEGSGISYNGFGPDRICGAVNYEYEIGKYETTAGQYVEFLNAVAATDTYGLYNASMWSHSEGCKIQRSGTAGSYVYSVAADRANRPVNFVSWGDAARFANWLHNGQPMGAQDSSTTEEGSYDINGAVSNADLLLIDRDPDASWVVPSEDEWYKSAYHKNDGATDNYFDFATRSDTAPSNNLLDPDPGNRANYYSSGYAIGSPYWRTVVGELENSESSYGTFDQSGNVWEWNEAVINSSSRGLRGGSYNDTMQYMKGSYRVYSTPESEFSDIGFRLAFIPEPASMLLLGIGCLALMQRKRNS